MYISAEIFQKWNCFYENYAKTYEVRIAYNKKLNRNSNCQCQIQIEAKLPSINFFSSYSKDIKHTMHCYHPDVTTKSAKKILLQFPNHTYKTNWNLWSIMFEKIIILTLWAYAKVTLHGRVKMHAFLTEISFSLSNAINEH